MICQSERQRKFYSEKVLINKRTMWIQLGIIRWKDYLEVNAILTFNVFILCKVFFFSPFPQQGRSQLFIYSSATGWKDWSIYITSYHMRNMNFWKIREVTVHQKWELSSVLVHLAKKWTKFSSKFTLLKKNLVQFTNLKMNFSVHFSVHLKNISKGSMPKSGPINNL